MLVPAAGADHSYLAREREAFRLPAMRVHNVEQRGVTLRKGSDVLARFFAERERRREVTNRSIHLTTIRKPANLL